MPKNTNIMRLKIELTDKTKLYKSYTKHSAMVADALYYKDFSNVARVVRIS